MQLMGFDFGEKRIGVATAHVPTRICSPLTTLSAHHGRPDWEALDQLIAQRHPQRLVLGIPTHMDGTEAPITAQARKFGRRLAARYQLPVDEVDERLSSVQAEDLLQTQQREFTARSRRKGRRRDKAEVDRTAAALILQRYLDGYGPTT